VGAIALGLRAEIRRQWRTYLLLVVLVGLSGTAVLLGAAGARRSATAYSRFLTWADASDLGTGGGASNEEMQRVMDELASAPFTEASFRSVGAGRVSEDEDNPEPGFVGCCQLRGPSGRVFQPFQIGVGAGLDGDLTTGTIDRAKLLSGRWPDPSNPDDAIADFSAAKRLGAKVGDRLELVADDGSTFPLTLVGTIARPGGFPTLNGASFSSVGVTEAFRQRHPDLFNVGNAGISVKLKPGTKREDVEQWIGQHAGSVDVLETSATNKAAARAISVETNSTWVITAVLVVVFVLLTGQLLLRQATLAQPERARLQVLGFRSRDVVALGTLAAVAVGLMSAVLAVVLSVLASPMTPIGLARLAEPRPGIRVDLAVLVFGALAVVAVAALLGALTTWRLGRLAARERARSRRWLPLPGSRPPVMVGAHFLTRPARAGELRPARTTALAVGLLVVSLVASVVVLQSLHHLTRDRTLSGATWDAAVAPDHPGSDSWTDEDVARTRTLITDQPNVVTTTESGWASVLVGPEHRELMAQVFEDGGRIEPAIAAGRVPRVAGEIAMGDSAMKELGVGIGDTIELQGTSDRESQGEAVKARIVGQSVLASPIFFPGGAGDGLAMPFATARLMEGDIASTPGITLVKFEPGTDVVIASTQLSKDVPNEITFSSADRNLTGGIERVQTLPRALIVVLLLVCAAALIHLLVTSLRRRWRDVAILRTLGLTRRQVRQSLALHALGFTVVVLAVGVPLGLIAGRVAWRASADFLGVVPSVTMSPMTLLAVGIGVIVLGQLATIFPAWRVGHLRPANLLRAD